MRCRVLSASTKMYVSSSGKQVMIVSSPHHHALLSGSFLPPPCAQPNKRKSKQGEAQLQVKHQQPATRVYAVRVETCSLLSHLLYSGLNMNGFYPHSRNKYLPKAQIYLDKFTNVQRPKIAYPKKRFTCLFHLWPSIRTLQAQNPLNRANFHNW